jgi:hypothetical protein
MWTVTPSLGSVQVSITALTDGTISVCTGPVVLTEDVTGWASVQDDMLLMITVLPKYRRQSLGRKMIAASGVTKALGPFSAEGRALCIACGLELVNDQPRQP